MNSWNVVPPSLVHVPSPTTALKLTLSQSSSMLTCRCAPDALTVPANARTRLRDATETNANRDLRMGVALQIPTERRSPELTRSPSNVRTRCSAGFRQRRQRDGGSGWSGDSGGPQPVEAPRVVLDRHDLDVGEPGLLRVGADRRRPHDRARPDAA